MSTSTSLIAERMAKSRAYYTDRLGFAVVPIHPGRKKPLERHTPAPAPNCATSWRQAIDAWVPDIPERAG